MSEVETGPSDFDKAHISRIVGGERLGDWFSAHLFRLIHHADRVNYAKIKAAFPKHVDAYEDWVRGEDDGDE